MNSNKHQCLALTTLEGFGPSKCLLYFIFSIQLLSQEHERQVTSISMFKGNENFNQFKHKPQLSKTRQWEKETPFSSVASLSTGLNLAKHLNRRSCNLLARQCRIWNDALCPPGGHKTMMAFNWPYKNTQFYHFKSLKSRIQCHWYTKHMYILNLVCCIVRVVISYSSLKYI